MKFDIEFRGIAEHELDEAIAWYNNERHGLGTESADEVRLLLTRIAEFPDRFPRANSIARRADSTGFPYSIFYRVRDDRVIVVAVFHQARNPSEWQSRT